VDDFTKHPRLHRPGPQLLLPVKVYRFPLCQALAGLPHGGNGFVLAGVVAVTALSWRVNCGSVSSITPKTSSGT
jgi:hypothetical protein